LGCGSADCSTVRIRQEGSHARRLGRAISWGHEGHAVVQQHNHLWLRLWSAGASEHGKPGCASIQFDMHALLRSTPQALYSRFLSIRGGRGIPTGVSNAFFWAQGNRRCAHRKHRTVTVQLLAVGFMTYTSAHVLPVCYAVRMSLH
jgi:hypothetical protein